MYSVYQHWDPLKTCVVGRSYPPEFYSWITVPHVRSLMEKIAIETEEDFQNIIKKLHEFGVKTMRPELPKNTLCNGHYTVPPMCPRDIMVMIGTDFYAPGYMSYFGHEYNFLDECYSGIIDHVSAQGNAIKASTHPSINGAMISRIGKDLYFGTIIQGKFSPRKYRIHLKAEVEKNFLHTRNHILDTDGHGDGVYCPVCPGLIISLFDISSYGTLFPGWEVVYLPNQSWEKVKPFLDLKRKNNGRWWIPGFEYDNQVIETIESWLSHWTGYVEETVFDVNMLIIDPKNVMVFGYNKLVFDALDRYGITPHIVPFRHRYFWDGGIHCVTLDLDREGTMQDYFPQRA